MPTSKLLIRAAMRMQEVWRSAARTKGVQSWQAMGQFDDCYRALTQARDRLAKASLFGLSAILPELQREVRVHLSELHNVAGQIANEAPQTSNMLSLQWFLAELQQIEADFEGLKIDLKAKTIGTTTEPITLEDVYLGSFYICLPWEKAASYFNYLCFDVMALDPNPSGVNDDVTHPHVKTNKICAGDATLPIKKALEQGRLADAFSLVNSVLTTYNLASPFVKLSDWGGTTCSDCGHSVRSDSTVYCEGCNSDVCDDCSSVCSDCQNLRCLSCLESCAACQQSCCAGCLDLTTDSGRNCCSSCLQECPACNGRFAEDEAAEDSNLCPACRLRCQAGDNAAAETNPNETSPNLPVEDANHATSLESDALPITA